MIRRSADHSSRLAVAAVAMVAVIVVSGCAYHGAALIESEPPGAEVVNLADDTVLGITPVKVWWRGSSGDQKFVNVRLQKSGYRDKTTSFWVPMRHGSRQQALGTAQLVEIELSKEND